MKITEKELLEGYDGICRGGAKKSIINNIIVYWEYRRINDDGYGACVCIPGRADQISLEYDRVGCVEIDDDVHYTHPAIMRIVLDEESLFGDEV